MRITENMKFLNIQQNIQKSNQTLFRANERVYTGKNINRPSDDPAGMEEVLGLKTLTSSIDQYLQNIKRSSLQLETYNLVLERAMDIVSKARSYAVTENNGVAGSTTRDIAADEVGLVLKELYSLANTKVEGKYIFSGFLTTTEAYDPADITFTYQGDAGQVDVAIDEGRKVQINITGEEVFDPGGGVNIFAELDALRTALQTDNLAGISATVTSLITAQDQIMMAQVKAGTTLNQLNAKEKDLDQYKVNVLDRLSAIEDVDMATAITELNKVQNSYEVTLAASARFLQTTLLDFLR